MISGETEINYYAEIRLILAATFGDNSLDTHQIAWYSFQEWNSLYFIY